MDWQIRPASADDASWLALIGSATFLETFAGVIDGAAIVMHCAREHCAERYADFLAEGCRAWLATVDPGAAPIGFALSGPPALPGAATDGSDVELKRIYTLSRFHGRGIGAALMVEATGQAAGGGARRLLLGVYEGNTRAIAFYRKQQFRTVGARRFRVGNQEYDDLVLARPLA